MIFDLDGMDNEEVNHFVDDFDIKMMASLIGRSLTDGCFQYRIGNEPNIRATVALEVNAKPIVHIAGRWEHASSKGAQETSRVHQQSCYVCGQYSKTSTTPSGIEEIVICRFARLSELITMRIDITPASLSRCLKTNLLAGEYTSQDTLHLP
jgi:hypothetical protein